MQGMLAPRAQEDTYTHHVAQKIEKAKKLLGVRYLHEGHVHKVDNYNPDTGDCVITRGRRTKIFLDPFVVAKFPLVNSS